MLTMAFMLAVMSTGIEMFFVIQYEGMRKFMINHNKFGLFFSFVLSYALGLAFGAAGLIAMFAAILSTILSLVIYSSGLLRYADQARRAEISAKFHSGMDTLKGTIRFWCRVISAPYRAYRSVKNTTVQMFASTRRFKNAILRR